MGRRVIQVGLIFLVVLILASPSYSESQSGQTYETLSNSPSNTPTHQEFDFSSEYSFARSLLKKDTATSPPLIAEEAESPAAQKTEVETLYKNYGFNKAVEKSINYYSKRIKEKFGRVLSRSGRYISIITEVFKEKNLPDELVFLPLIESGFNMYAYSPQKASGMWQFIASTGKRYGLKIDWWVDERRDPIKATAAAAEYLSDLYNMFGSWNLALAAYNAGEGKILRALNKTKTDDFWELRNTRHIKRETKDYVPFYIAATAIAKDPEGFGFEDINYYEPLAYDEVMIDAPMDLEAIARYAEVDVKEIKELNPELKRWCTPPNVLSYTARIPVGTKEKFMANLSNTTDSNDLSIDYYTIKKGDTLKKIASRLGVSTEAILELNSLSKGAQLKVGETILVPPKRVAHLTKDSDDVKGKKVFKNKKKTKVTKKRKGSYLITSTGRKGKAS